MRQDLDNLRKEIDRLLRDGAYVVYHSRSRVDETMMPILWDTERHPDPSEFLDTALSIGVKLVVYHYREMTEQVLEDGFEKLEAAGLPRDRHRELERELKRLKGYVGFTSDIELSFDFDRQTYMYEATAPWYNDFLNVLDELDEIFQMGGEEPPSMGGGYFSQN
ncbi:MAG: hypothetical protein FJW31_13445 [Acidobacteria bacterium]|nr:hypothetical protein [Acidobacteriota bacterium]